MVSRNLLDVTKGFVDTTLLAQPYDLAFHVGTDHELVCRSISDMEHNIVLGNLCY